MSEKESKRGTGPTRKSEEECHEAFNAFTEALGLENLVLNVDEKTGKCTVVHVDGRSFTTRVKPVAGNTFLKLLEGASTFAPDISQAS